MFEQYEIEEIILGMASIVQENRELKWELKKARQYEKKYNDLLNQNVKAANESSAALVEAILGGAFATK